MKRVAIGVHLRSEDIEPLAEAVPAGPVFLSAVVIPDEQSLSDRDLLVRIAKVRAELLDRATFIAIRYGFAFHTDAEAAAKALSQASRWQSLLTANASRVELTLKVAAAGGPRPDRHEFESGAGYLRALFGAKEAAAVDSTFRRATESLIVPLCVSHRWITRDTSSVELAALIERSRLAELGIAGDALKLRCPRVPFLLSAPWPLEVFADADQQ